MSIKGYELMRLVAENPEKYEGKKYKLNPDITSGMVAVNINGETISKVIVCEGDLISSETKALIFVSKDTELEEIKQPVTAQEAAKAYMEGKKVIREYEGMNHMFIKRYDCLAGTFACDMLMDYIANGTWYIED